MDLDLSQLFNGFTTQDSILILAFLLVAFLLGLLTGWVLQNSRVRKIENERHNKEAQLQQMGQERSHMEEELSLKEADLKRASFELEESHAARRLLLGNNQRLEGEMDALRLALEKSQAANRQYLSTVEDLNDQILGLKTRNAQLSEQTKFSGTEGEPEPGALEGPLLTSGFAEDRLAELEKRLRLLEEEREQMRHGSAQGNAEGMHPLPVKPADLLNERQLEVFENEDDSDQDAEPMVSSPSFTLTTQSAQQRVLVRDDLTRIDGIGPFLERRLNDAGIFTFEQISQWDAEQIKEITGRIQFFEGRIEKDDWVGQASAFLENPPAPQTIEEPANSSPEAEDDLKVIEGIGPAIEEILKKAGIKTWDEMAKMDPVELETILQVADPRLKMFDAGTWPAQARLAMNGEWEVLQDYQGQLRAGRHVPDEEEN